MIQSIPTWPIGIRLGISQFENIMLDWKKKKNLQPNPHTTLYMA